MTRNVLFVHGFADVTRSWHRLGPFLASHGYAVHFHDYPTLRNSVAIPAIAEGLAAAAERVFGGAPFQCLAHSQGGLVAEWFDAFGGHGGKLQQVIAIAAPFQGSSLPLFFRSAVLAHWPVGRKQVQDLASFSPIVKTLVAARRRMSRGATPYVCLIGHAGRLRSIEGDWVVSVCEANRSARFYRLRKDGVDAVPYRPVCRTVALKRSHLPRSYVRQLDRDGNRFAKVLLAALAGKTVTEAVPGTQFALVAPRDSMSRLAWPDNAHKILVRTTADRDYWIVFGGLDGGHTASFRLDGCEIRVEPGLFTYVLDTE